MNDHEMNEGQADQHPPTANDKTAYTASPAQAPFSNDANETSNKSVYSVASQVKDKAAAALSSQKDGIADQIDDFAKTVHKTGNQFAGKQDWVAGAIERGATELGSLATSLRNNDLSSLLTQVTSMARKQPALFVGASLVAGFAVARLGKIVVADVSRDDLPTMEVGHGSH